MALSIGIAYAAWLFPAGSLWPRHPLDQVFNGDLAQSVTGQRYFLAQPWAWPPLLASKLDWPRGLSVGLTDSIPLALLPLKLVRGWLPPGFYLQQGWVALVWALQPVGFVWALRAFGERRLLVNLAGAVLSLCPTFLILRYGHNALASQVVILAAFALYAGLTRQPSAARWLGAAALLCATLLIHPYLLAMVAAILLAVPATLLVRRDRRWRGAAFAYGIALLACGGLAVALGYGGGGTPTGYGFYSMNILGPLLPQGSALFGDHAIDATGGQALEGCSYLGFGLLLLSAATLVQAVRVPAAIPWSRHAGLLLLAVALTLFAVSGTPTLGRWTLFRLRHVPEMAKQFRATGRFFWPVAYLMMLTALIVLPRTLPWRIAAPLLIAASALQAIDVSGMAQSRWRDLRTPAQWSIDEPVLAPIFAAHDRLTIWPSFGCGAEVSPGHAIFEDLLQIASRTTMRLSTMYASRIVNWPDCDAERVLGTPLQPGELRVITPPASRNAAVLVPGSKADCRRSGDLALCSATPGMLATLPVLTPDPVPLGVTLGSQAMRERLVPLDGWAEPEAAGLLTDGKTARLYLPLAPGTRPYVKVTLAGLAVVPSAQRPQRVRVLAEDTEVADWSFAAIAQDSRSFTAPVEGGASPHILLTFDIAEPTRPHDLIGNADMRTLGYLLAGIRVDRAPAP